MTEPDKTSAACEVERLVQANAASNATLTKLVDKVRIDAEHRERKIELLEADSRRNRRILLLVGVAVALLLTLAIVNAFSIQAARRNAAQTAAAAKTAQDTYQLLYGCFDPNSECAKLNNDSQKRLLDEIKLYELTAFYCEREHPEAVDPDSTRFFACLNRLYPDGPQLKER